MALQFQQDQPVPGALGFQLDPPALGPQPVLVALQARLDLSALEVLPAL
ncbi:MAG TPA: hypothetical protein VLZ10_02300 [Thermodesulfobacteriota bacterium]|nr:hypothetical protein [Thermodesulfobacteriota bacterium]